MVDQELLEALWDLAGGSLQLDHDDVAFELTNAFLCSHQIQGGPHVDDGQGDLLFLERLLDLLLYLHAPSRLELDGRAVREELVTHLLELQVRQIQKILLRREQRCPLPAARSSVD